MTNPWLDPSVAQAQRALVDQQLQQSPPPPHFQALASAVRSAQCPGEILVVGAGVGHEREVLDRAGVQYRSFAGVDISPEAIRLAKERYPESTWILDEEWHGSTLSKLKRTADVVVDASCVLHVDDWRAHLRALCAASRRWVILHRVPSHAATFERPTQGYGHVFPARVFNFGDIDEEMLGHGYRHVNVVQADGDSHTITYAKPRHYVSYCDVAYLPRLRALHASMVRHCGPFELHVLAWDRTTYAEAIKLPNVRALQVSTFFEQHVDLQLPNLPGPPRTTVEHMWTCGPQWIADVMAPAGTPDYGTGVPATYVDADVMFFSSPEPVFAEIGGAPAAVVPHGFARAAQGLPGPTLETHRVFGAYNVGLVYAADREFPERWAEQCRVSCYDRLIPYEYSVPNAMIMGMEDRTGYDYADQSWLDEWPVESMYASFYPRPRKPWTKGPAHVVQHPGACCGPWQAHTRALDVRDGVVHFGGRPLVSYHFSGYRELPDGHSVMTRPEYMLSRRQEELIYARYIEALEEAKR